MSPSDQHVLNCIGLMVWSGYYSADDIQSMIGDILDAHCDEAVLRAAVEPELAKKRAAEATWPNTTDCDRLDAVFYALHEQGICALSNTGRERSDGYTAVAAALATAPKGHYRGYCFYHGQDVDRAIEGHGVMIAFGDLDDKNESGLAIGSAVASALRAAGFAVEWNGSIETRINLPAFLWQRRGSASRA